MTRLRWTALVFTLITVLQIAPSLASDAVPVLLWGGSANSDLPSSPVNPFLKTTREEFDMFLHKKLENSPPVLLYVKDNLCVEDFVQHKQLLQKVVNVDHLNYFPAVEKAVNAVEDLPAYNQSYNDYADSIAEGQLLIMPISSLDISLEAYKTMKDSSPNLVTMITGRSCSYRRSERVKRDANDNNNSTDFIVATERILLYSSKPLNVSDGKNVVTLHNKPTARESGLGTKDSMLQLILKYIGANSSVAKYTFIFNFEVKSSGYYTLRTVNYELVSANKDKDNENYTLTANMDIFFPFNFSYHCSQSVAFKNSKNSTFYLEIANLQVQIDPKILNNEGVFDDAYDCVGFTTIPIWTGIFVTAILALVMIWALTMIMDIRTMDRFDDPKGKAINIFAQD